MDGRTIIQMMSRFIIMDVLSANTDEIYFFDQMDDDEKLEIFKNTLASFEQIESIELDDTILKDLTIDSTSGSNCSSSLGFNALTIAKATPELLTKTH